MAKKTFVAVEPSKSQASLMIEHGSLAVNPSRHALFSNANDDAHPAIPPLMWPSIRGPARKKSRPS